MAELKRVSPVEFQAAPQDAEVRDHWTVVRRYAGEGPGPWLVDLSHKPRWDFQDVDPDRGRAAGLAVPSAPGACRLQRRVLTARLNPTQMAAWHLGSAAPPVPTENGFTDVTEATVLVALFGPAVFAVTEKLTALDLTAEDLRPPFLFQGPFCRIACKVAVLARESGHSGGVLVAGARGYAHDLVRAVRAAGSEHGLRPAGEDRFAAWLNTVVDGQRAGAGHGQAEN